MSRNVAKPKQIFQIRTADDPVGRLLFEARTKPVRFSDGFKSPRVRQSWRDVLYGEDPSQHNNKAKTIGDLVGATFSYGYDGKSSNTSTWSAIGALILPWEMDFEDKPLGGFDKVALAPSISINRVGSSDATNQGSNSLSYRVGVYADWLPPSSIVAGTQIRAAGVYVTDLAHEAQLPGFEVDIEPRWQNPVLPLGFRKILVRKMPLLEEGADQSLLDVQIRTWLHIEGGDILDAGSDWEQIPEGFLRLGPALQVQLNAPRLILGRDFSITALYSYLGVVSGPAGRNSFFEIAAALTLLEDSSNHKISLTTQFQIGGLNLTKEDVESLTVGLGVVF